MTSCLNTKEVLFEQSKSPLYVAVSDGVPTARLFLMKDAIPPTSSAAPICLIPFLKIRIPVGAIDPVELKLAVRVIGGWATMFPNLASTRDLGVAMINSVLRGYGKPYWRQKTSTLWPEPKCPTFWIHTITGR